MYVYMYVCTLKATFRGYQDRNPGGVVRKLGVLTPYRGCRKLPVLVLHKFTVYVFSTITTMI